MHNKKGEVDPIKIIMIFVILAVVVAIMVYYFNTQIGKEKAITEGQLDALSTDTDKDGVVDFMDKCKDSGSLGKTEYSGCQTEEDLRKAENQA